MELLGLAVYIHTLLGIKLSHLGSSGITDKKLSSLNLKVSTLQFDISLTFTGRQLKSLGPLIWKEFSLRDLLLQELDETNGGIAQRRPLRPELYVLMLQLGTRPSIHFQV